MPIHHNSARDPLNGCDYSETRFAARWSVRTTPKLIWLPAGGSGLLRNSFGCQSERAKTVLKRVWLPGRPARLVGSWLLELPDISLLARRGGRVIKGMLEESKPAVLRGLVLWPGCTAV